jgi:hypothetical protein
MFILLQLLSSFALFTCLTATSFSPDTSDYDAYGLKIAANSLMIVEAQNDYTTFLVQFAPFTDNITQTYERSCILYYGDPSQYIYAVALGKNQSTYDVFFVGEMIDLDEDDNLTNRTFVSILNYTGSFTTIDCDAFTYPSETQFVDGAFAHQEHLVMVTDPLGLVAYGFSDLFTFSYTASTNNLTVHPNNSLSPSISFLPFAIDYDGNRGVIAGFFKNDKNARM